MSVASTDRGPAEAEFKVRFERRVEYPDISQYLRTVSIDSDGRHGSEAIDTARLNVVVWERSDPESIARSGVDRIQFRVLDEGGMGEGGSGP